MKAKFMVPADPGDLPPIFEYFDSFRELADAVGVTPQALYIRRGKPGGYLVTAEEAAKLLTEYGVPLHISRPDLFPKLRRA